MPPARPSIEDRLAAAGLPPLPRTAWLELDLDALRANLAIARELAGPGVLVEPVVKADAYGHGMIPIAGALVGAGADGLCVATLDEAIALRAAGVRGRITVLYPIPPALARAAAANGIAVAAGDTELLAGLLETIGSAPAFTALEGELEVELEIETGLGRGGVPLEGAVDAARAIAAAPRARLSGIWTHMQAVEDRSRTSAQVERFEATSSAIARAGVDVPRRHVAASAGLLTNSIPVYDAVRPGLMTYGLPPDELPASSLHPAAARLRPVMSIVARPVRVADLPAGHGISYGPTFETGRPSRIATLPLGYGDGWPRSLSNRAEALVRGVRAPLVGNVAMDACMVDVTDVPGPPVGVEDEFVLLGAQGGDRITAADLARARTTNSWEVVTSAAGRLPRVYDAAAGALDVRTLLPAEDPWLASNSGTETSAISRSTPS
ncbi:MAG TPA: alanine racemase [Candidatus Limnocylindrales bacterium]|nr:alanine racemase [Candidatus Limnocylindrales bacterium]